jgi:hypothetical protein
MGKMSRFFGKSLYFVVMNVSHLIPSVESSPMVGNSFVSYHPDINECTYENFEDWARKQFVVEDSESDDEAEVPVHMQKAKDISFERNKQGVLVVPPMDDYDTVRKRQRVVRGYVGAVYREFIQFTNLFFFLFESQAISLVAPNPRSPIAWLRKTAKKYIRLIRSRKGLS